MEPKVEQQADEPATKRGIFSRVYMLGPVEKDHSDLALLACCVVTGLVDAACFRNYGMFVGMQTGTPHGHEQVGIRSVF